uniref:Uncharacterized protein n=1 Tax=Salix viminalis TaxID=40686 RepID=A0A6N2KFL9_SALVM
MAYNYGVEIEFEKIRSTIRVLDLSDNSFTGEIPKVIGKLKALQQLNLSHNSLTGHIHSSLGNLTNLESLDLSSNSLTGRIPTQLGTWTKLLSKAGIVTSPFTRQENTIVQTCVVACYSIAVGGGFGSYLLGLNRKTYEQAGVDTEGNTPGSTKEPGIGWMTGFLFESSFTSISA